MEHRFSGRQGKGAMRQVRERKRNEAEVRNEATPDHQRRSWRRTVVDSETFDRLLEDLEKPPEVIPWIAEAAKRNRTTD